MSKHAPWTKEQAEQWAKEWTESTFKKNSAIHSDDAYLAGLAKAAEMIEACETIRFTLRDGKVHTGSYEVFEAKLAGVRPIEEEK